MAHFTEAILTASEARAVPLCGYNNLPSPKRSSGFAQAGQRATRLAAKSARPHGGGAYRGAGGVAALARCAHRAAHRAYPGDPIRSHEMSHYQ
jgi:hypothetical protein